MLRLNHPSCSTHSAVRRSSTGQRLRRTLTAAWLGGCCAIGASAIASPPIQLGVALNPDRPGGLAANLPAVDSALVDWANFAATYNAANPPTELTATGTWQMIDQLYGKLLIQNFKHELVSVDSGAALGVENPATLAPLFAAYFAAHPDAEWALGWNAVAENSALNATLSTSSVMPRDLSPWLDCGDGIDFTLKVTGAAHVGYGVAGIKLVGATCANQLCVYVDDAGATGHGWVELVDSDGNRLVKGRYGSSQWKPISPARIKDDTQRAWNRKICYRLNTQDYNDAATWVNAQITTPGNYNLFGANCVEFARRAAEEGRVTLPNTLDAVGIDDPRAVNASLKDLFDNALTAPGCGRVLIPGLGGLAGAPPLDFSPSGLTELALDDPAAASDLLDAPLVVVDDGTLLVAPGVEAAVTIIGVDGTNALIAVDWGDRSPATRQDANASHVYAAPGVHAARAIVIDAGAVHLHTFTAVVAPGAATSPLVIVIDQFPPVGQPNDGWESDELVPLIPSTSCASDCNANGVPDCEEIDPCGSPCVADLNHDGIVDGGDLGAMLAVWATADGAADLNGDGAVNGADLGVMLGAWGPCAL